MAGKLKIAQLDTIISLDINRVIYIFNIYYLDAANQESHS